LITARTVLDYGEPVYAVLATFTGSFPILDPDDVSEALGLVEALYEMRNVTSSSE
jgi:hypothetical protein